MDGPDPNGPDLISDPQERFHAPGLIRSRLLACLDAARPAGLALVIAPAGFGKTTLLTQYAAAHDGPVTWHSVDPADPRAGGRLAEVVRSVGGTAGTDQLLIVDNADTLMGTPDEAAIERCVADRPSGVHLILAGRRMPALNVLRHEVFALPGIIGPDQLRFRTWEVERLLSTVYAEPLPVDDVAVLTRRTGGWAAGLAMFHLSTRGQSLAARQRAVAVPSGRWAIAHGYLTDAVLAGLDDELRDFVVRTSVFDVLTGRRCDQLLDRSGSDRVLQGLAQRYGLPVTVDGGQSYQYHPVLRSHLAVMLVEDVGEAEAAQWHGRAARLLAREGAYAQAVRAHARSGDWTAVRALLARVGGALADQAEQPFDDVLPSWLLAADPWLVYAEARRRLGQGQLHAATQGFGEARELFSDASAARRCHRERMIAAAWLMEEQPGRTHWSSWLRAAVRGDPATVAGEAIRLPGAGGELVRLLSEVLAGNLRAALRHAATSHNARFVESSTAALGLGLVRAAVRLITGQDSGMELHQVADEADSVGLAWLSRVARAAHALGDDPAAGAEAYAIAAECERHGDAWGKIVATLLGCLHDARFGESQTERQAAWPAQRDTGRHIARLARLADDCGRLGAGTLQAWARALLALTSVEADLPDAEHAATLAADFATAAGVPGARIAATAALVRLDPGRRDLLDAARDEAAAVGLPDSVLDYWLAQGTGPPIAAPAAPVTVPVAEVAPVADVAPVMIQCFGGFRMEIGGVAVALGAVRARARSVLRLLAMRAGQVVHREVIMAALWPDLPPAAATRNLHVSISALRGLLEPESGRGKAQLLIRSGDAYGVALPPGGYADTTAFAEAVVRCKRLRRGRDREAEVDALRAALAAYGGDLLPEDGPADWVVQAREEFRRQATDVARALAVVELERGNIAEAAAAAENCLEFDPHDDEAWRVLIRAHTAGGAPAKAMEVRRRYGEMLASLGLSDARVLSLW